MITRMFMKKERAPKTYDGFATPPRGPRFLWPVRIISLTIMVSIAALVNQVEIMAAIALVGLSAALWLLYFRNLWRRREQRFRALIQRSSHASLLIAEDGSILFASPASQELLGLQPEELAGRRNLLELTDADNYAYVDEFLRDIAAEEIRSTSWELRLLHADGTLRDVAVDAANCRRDKQLGGILIDLYDISNRSEAVHMTRRQAYYDELTGLANRELLTDRIQQTIARAGRSGEQFAVAMIDLDRFRVVNEGLGREAGDQLLVTVAQRLARTIRPGDTLARLGGDEFAVLLEGVTLPGQAAVVMERFVEALEEPIVIDAQEILTTFSAGIAIQTPSHALPDDMLRDAEVALYRAKAEGRNRFAIFNPSTRNLSREILSIEADLYRAIEANSIGVSFQPEVRLSDATIVAAEATLEWKHPDRGIIRGEELTAIADEAGLLDSIGKQVIAAASQQASIWQNRFPETPLVFAVNLDAAQLDDPEFPMMVAEAVRDASIDPSLLRLDIAESMLFNDAKVAAVAAIGESGVSIGLSGAGSSYSSLGNLSLLRISTVRLAPELVARLDNSRAAAAVRAIIVLAHGLDVEVVAEGVSSDDQMEELKQLGCDRARGTFFSEALALTSLARGLGSDDEMSIAA